MTNAWLIREVANSQDIAALQEILIQILIDHPPQAVGDQNKCWHHRQQQIEQTIRLTLGLE